MAAFQNGLGGQGHIEDPAVHLWRRMRFAAAPARCLGMLVNNATLKDAKDGHLAFREGGSGASKAEIVGDWRKLYGKEVTGHSTRRSGALREELDALKVDSQGANNALADATKNIEGMMDCSSKYLPPQVRSSRHQVVHKNCKTLVFSASAAWKTVLRLALLFGKLPSAHGKEVEKADYGHDFWKVLHWMPERLQPGWCKLPTTLTKELLGLGWMAFQFTCHLRLSRGIDTERFYLLDGPAIRSFTSRLLLKLNRFWGTSCLIFSFFFMDLILGHCWIWVKLVMDKALKEVCWLEELVRVVEQLYGADAVKVSTHATLHGFRAIPLRFH